jgi:hypothetical protein
MTYPTIFERLRAMQPEESLSALIGEACDVGDELVDALERLTAFADEHVNFVDVDPLLRSAADALAKARRCPDGECTEKCVNGGAA